MRDQGRRRIELKIDDAAGNASDVAFDILVDRPPVLSVPEIAETKEGATFQVSVFDPDNDPIEVSAVIVDHDGRPVSALKAQPIGAALFGGSLPAKILSDARPLWLLVTAKDDKSAKSAPVRLALSKPNQNGKIEPVDLKLSETDAYLRVEVTCSVSPARPPRLKIEWMPAPPDPDAKIASQPVIDATELSPGNFEAFVPWPADWEGEAKVSAEVAYPSGNQESATESIVVRAIREDHKVSFPDGSADLVTAKKGVYYPFLASLSHFNPPGGQELKPVSDGIRIGRREMPFAEDPDLVIKMPDGIKNPRQVGVYLRDSGRWWFFPSEREKDGSALKASIGHLGSFALMRDSTPPALGEVQPRNKSIVTDKTPLIFFSLSDEGSGLSEGGMVLMLDGKKVISEWQPFKGRVVYQPDRDLPKGPHELSLTVTDRAGNTSRTKSSFTIAK